MVRCGFERWVALPIALWIGLMAPAPAAAQSWETRIAAARAEAEAFAAYGAAHGWDYNRIGTFTRRADAGRLRCTILAELIGIGDISEHVDFYGPAPWERMALPGPGVTPDDGLLQKLLTYAWNREVWANMAEQVLPASADQRAETWELQCNGQHGIPEGLLGPRWDTEASFRVDGGALYVLGDIVPGFYAEFAQALARNDIRTVMLGSRGGSVLDAMQAGGLIRQEGLAVALYGDCESACPLVYVAGAAPRIQDLPLHRLGFHQISVGGAAIPLDHEIYEVVAAYIDAMGVNSDYILTAMQDTPPETMWHPPYQWLCDAGVAWFYGNCTQPHPLSDAGRAAQEGR